MTVADVIDLLKVMPSEYTVCLRSSSGRRDALSSVHCEEDIDPPEVVLHARD